MKHKLVRLTIGIIWSFAIIGAFAFWGLFYMVSSNTSNWFGPMPNLETLENPKTNL
jgi:hypothetical protein